MNQTLRNATHIASDGTFYRQAGQWWLVWRHDAWWVVSGDPSVTLSPLH